MKNRIVASTAALCVVVLLILPLLLPRGDSGVREGTMTLPDTALATAASGGLSPALPENLKLKTFARIFVRGRNNGDSILTPEERLIYGTRLSNGWYMHSLFMLQGGRVVRVINSDKLECEFPGVSGTMKVSLLGVRPPEEYPTPNQEEIERLAKHFIEERQKSVASIVLVNKTTYVSVEGQPTPYLVYLLPEQKSEPGTQPVGPEDSAEETTLLNLELIQRGLAKADDRYEFPLLGQYYFREAELYARNERLGMWAKAVPME